MRGLSAWVKDNGPAQFLVLAFQLLESLALAGRQPIALASIDFLALAPTSPRF
ncbi:MAG TPA: hypothetical protein VNK45_11485 [Candidatus Acidoferrales bacterium]|nr:hypothetical protein [Candidatus Acidoferrales bacterium]